ncbi:MAG: hypothetical protein H7Y59_10280 [Anaerolineales bacterium]|nr:hypothetical protein [Anaerolineales bacterium]
MTSFFIWYIIITLLGWLTFPLAHYLFPALADRGYTLSRAAGLLIWGYIFWLFASFGIAQNDMGGILLALAFLIGLSIWSIVNRQFEIVNFIKSNTTLVITTEILFFIAFAFMAFVRSANPDLNGTERPMELAFINGILRSPVFPPQDPWLSGYAISYYYFGYVMTAMLARISNVTGSMAHNLMTSLIFALGAVGSYGILYNLLTKTGYTQQSTDDQQSSDAQVSKPHSTFSALLAPLFLLLVSNFGALLEILHQGGLFWQKDSSTGEYSSQFWAWLDMKELSQVPAIPFHWLPLERYLWWWRSSRIIQDYDMVGGFKEVIDEFPFFSFLLGDLHPHVLAIPFSLLAIAVALNLFLGGWRGTIKLERFLLGAQLHINYAGFLFSALVIGGLAFLNTWDILVGATLIVAAYVFWRANEDGWHWNRVEDLFMFGLPLGILSVLLYFPFYLGFSSQAGGLLPNFMYPTRGVHLWMMWGTLLIPIFAYLIYLWRGERIQFNWKRGFLLGLGFVFFLWILSLLISWIASFVEKDFVISFLAGQGMNASQFFGATLLRRLTYIGSLITLLALFIPSLAHLFASNHQSETGGLDTLITERSELVDPQSEIVNHKSQTSNQFVLLILTLGTILVLAPEFVYLRDQFGYRINTVFKFYYQAWMLWSLVAAFAVAYLLRNLHNLVATIGFRVMIGIVIFIGLLYPVFGVLTKTNNFKPTYGFTLDDFDRIKRENPEEAAAIEFLHTQPDGVITEAVGDGYSAYGRISMFTGMQTVLGWKGHEAQWRGSYEPQGSRNDDIIKLYTTVRWEEAQLIIEKYNIRYIYIGNLERSSMNVNEEKFKTYLKPIFEQGTVIIYEVP